MTAAPRELPPKVTVLSGGVGGARFIQGVQRLRERTGSDTEITVIANTGDDIWLHGLKVCPDLDTVMYTLGDGIDTDRGWGRKDETWHAKEELAAYGVEPTWFGLGDRDLATHLVRTQMLDAGYPLSAVTEALCRRWLAPAHGQGLRLLPMSDDRVETHIVIDDPESGERRAVHFQEYWIRHQAAVPAHSVVAIGADKATPAPGVLEAIAAADLLVIAPSNPYVSIAPILAARGIRDAVAQRSVPCVAVSPLISGRAVKGPADQMLATLAGGTSPKHVARCYEGLIDALVVDESDVLDLEGLGSVRPIVARTLMRDADARRRLAATALGGVPA